MRLGRGELILCTVTFHANPAHNNLTRSPYHLFVCSSSQLRNDIAVVVTALNIDASALECASAALRDDADVVGIAIQIDGLALEWASERLRDDAALVEVSLLFTVTLHANSANNLTCPPHML